MSVKISSEMGRNDILKKWWLYVLIAVHSVFITYICYVAGNVPYSFGSEVKTAKWLNVISGWLTDGKEELPDEILPVNVFYDKQFVEVADQYDMPLGTIDVTDRTKLYRLLSAIDSVGNYKYVLCDILFNEEYKTSSDSALFELISRMPRIVVAGGEDLALLPEQIRHRAFCTRYNVSIEEGDFTKYPLKYKDRESVALKMWTDLYDGTLGGNVFWSHSNGRLCRSSMFLQLPVRISEEGTQYQSRPVLNMGTDLLDVQEFIDLQSLLSEKIILIGSFVEDDIHNTVVGEMPGIMINYNAFHALREGRHYVRTFSTLLLFVIFYIITVVMIAGGSVFEWLPKKFRPESVIMKLLCSVVSLSTLFTIVFLFFYMAFGETYDILFIAGYFSLLSMIKNLYMDHIHKTSIES